MDFELSTSCEPEVVHSVDFGSSSFCELMVVYFMDLESSPLRSSTFVNIIVHFCEL